MSETYFIKQSRKDKFTILDNTCIRDSTLSWKSKGVHTYLMSLPDDWKIFITEIVNHSVDGKSALYSAIQELEKHGYVRKVRNRRDNGCFESTVYYVYEKPNTTISPLSDFPDVDNPDLENPDTDNQTQLNTNKLNNNIQKTKLTNYEQAVRESVFENIIRGLFGGEYLFDNQFEADVLRRLENAEIDLSQLENYLKYVFERTKMGNPIKSFEGLFRKLALSSSISRDFKLSLINKSGSKESESNPYQNKIVCPICGTVFVQYEYYCPACSLSVDAIKSKDEQEIAIKSYLYQMSEEDRSKYEADYQALVKQKGRGFLTTDEQIQFYKDYGILN